MRELGRGAHPLALDRVEHEGHAIVSRARAGAGGGWVVTVTIFGGARPEAIAVCDLGAHVAFADPAVAEAAGVAFGKRWVETHLLS